MRKPTVQKSMPVLKAEDLVALFGSSEKEAIETARKDYVSKNIEKIVPIDTHNIEMSKDDCMKLCKKINYVYQEGDETRVFKMVMSSESMDRMGDIVKCDGGIFDDYWPNPVIMPFHDTRTFPIGQMLLIEVEKKDLQVIATLLIVQEAVDITGVSEIFYKMMKAGLLRAGSINFMPVETIQLNEEEKAKIGQPWYGYIFSKWKLIEFTICSIPANQDCLHVGLSKGILNIEEIRKCKDQIPASWIQAVSKQLEAPTETVTAPIPAPVDFASMVKTIEGLTLKVEALSTQKSGAVLSKASKTLVEAAITELENLDTVLNTLDESLDKAKEALNALLESSSKEPAPDEEDPDSQKGLPAAQPENWFLALGKELEKSKT